MVTKPDPLEVRALQGMAELTRMAYERGDITNEQKLKKLDEIGEALENAEKK